PTGATLLLLATALTTCCTCPLFALPLHDSLRHRGRGANHRHASKREPTRQACVTTAVVASPMTMRANGYKAPLFQRPLTTRCPLFRVRQRGRRTKLLSVVRDHRSMRCSQPVKRQRLESLNMVYPKGPPEGMQIRAPPVPHTLGAPGHTFLAGP